MEGAARRQVASRRLLQQWRCVFDTTVGEGILTSSGRHVPARCRRRRASERAPFGQRHVPTRDLPASTKATQYVVHHLRDVAFLCLTCQVSGVAGELLIMTQLFQSQIFCGQLSS